MKSYEPTQFALISFALIFVFVGIAVTFQFFKEPSLITFLLAVLLAIISYKFGMMANEYNKV